MNNLLKHKDGLQSKYWYLIFIVYFYFNTSRSATFELVKQGTKTPLILRKFASFIVFFFLFNEGTFMGMGVQVSPDTFLSVFDFL